MMMKVKHDYDASCMCYRCKGIRNSPSFRKPIKVRKVKEKRASREDQHARYIDCGPQNWDDR
jgi:hypothetical protein